MAPRDSDRTKPFERNDRATDRFLATHAAAEYDDEPYTDAQRAVAEKGWQEYLRGDTVPWEEVRRELMEEGERGNP
jgi:hypothetical protein